MARGKAISRSEDQAIRLGLQNGRSVREIAEYLGRARQSVYKRVKAMEATGEIHQIEADFEGKDQ